MVCIKQIILLLFLLSSTSAKAGDILIKNITVFPMTSYLVIENQNVLIRDGKIIAIESDLKQENYNITTIIDGTNKYLMPSLADMHVHLPESDKIDKLLLSHVAAGVTQIRIMNSSVDQLELKKELDKRKDIIKPRIHFSHLVRRIDTFNESSADSLMRQIKNDGLEFVKLLSLSNESSFEHLTNAAKNHNVTICGHYPVYQMDGQSTMVDMEKVLNSNFKSIEHLAGYIWLQDATQMSRALELTKEKDIYNCPTLDFDIMSGDLQYPDAYQERITYKFLPSRITKDWDQNYLSAIEKAGGSEKVIASRDNRLPGYELKLKVLNRLNEIGCKLLIGGDAGNDFQADGFNVYEEMVNWSKGGIDNFTILKSATITPAQFFNEQNQWGTIEVGKNADLIILKQNPLENIEHITTIETTIVGGQVYINSELIDQL